MILPQPVKEKADTIERYLLRHLMLDKRLYNPLHYKERVHL